MHSIFIDVASALGGFIVGVALVFVLIARNVGTRFM